MQFDQQIQLAELFLVASTIFTVALADCYRACSSPDLHAR